MLVRIHLPNCPVFQSKTQLRWGEGKATENFKEFYLKVWRHFWLLERRFNRFDDVSFKNKPNLIVLGPSHFLPRFYHVYLYLSSSKHLSNCSCLLLCMSISLSLILLCVSHLFLHLTNCSAMQQLYFKLCFYYVSVSFQHLPSLRIAITA